MNSITISRNFIKQANERYEILILLTHNNLIEHQILKLVCADFFFLIIDENKFKYNKTTQIHIDFD